MPRRSGRGKRQRAASHSKGNKTVATVSKVEIRGRKLKVPTHPPEFVPVPWYNLIVRVEGITDITTSVLNIRLREQLALRGTAAQDFVQLRIINVRVWGPLVSMSSTTALQPLRVFFWNLIPARPVSGAGVGFSIQEECYDYPDQVRRAAVGYEYPIAQQQVAFNPNDSQPLLHITDGAGAGNVGYFRVLWRSSNANLQDVQFDETTNSFVRFDTLG